MENITEGLTFLTDEEKSKLIYLRIGLREDLLQLWQIKYLFLLN